MFAEHIEYALNLLHAGERNSIDFSSFHSFAECANRAVLGGLCVNVRCNRFYVRPYLMKPVDQSRVRIGSVKLHSDSAIFHTELREQRDDAFSRGNLRREIRLQTNFTES